VSTPELVTLACCDLAAITRGRSVFADELEAYLRRGIGWVPANHALTPMGPVADEDPFGSTGDLRLLPDAGTRARVEPAAEDAAGPLELLLCDIVETDGAPWPGCPRTLLRTTLEQLRDELGANAHASFEHEFQLCDDAPAAPPFSVQAQRLAGPFGPEAMGALREAGAEPERFFAEYAPHQFEIPVAGAEGLASADRAVVFREVVREAARRRGRRASFSPLSEPESAGNGVHIHLSLRDAGGGALLYDANGDGRLSELGGSFAAGILQHATALCALTAPSPVSYARLGPHHWSAGAVCVGDRNREALLRIPPLVSLGDAEPGAQMRLEYRAADATANPYVALAALLRAGMHGVRERLPAPPVLDRDPGRLPPAEAERFGVDGLPATLAEALEALGRDEELHGWMPAIMYDAFVSIKRTELSASARLDLQELCRRYVAIY
jgi:glutamine synthetase